jgi:PAS domain S-box-containing protein
VSAMRHAATWWRRVLGRATWDDPGASADVRGAPSRDPLGEVIEDLTFERVFEHIVDSSGDLVVLVDGAGRIRFASQAVIDLLGRRPEQIHGQSIAALVYQADLDRFRSLTDVRHPGDPQAAPVRARLRAADGRWRTLEWVISIPRSTDPGAAVLTGQEVGARIELPAELPPEPRRTPRDSLTDLPGS